MKKLLLSLLLILPLCGFAQKGMQGVGVNLGLGMTSYDGGITSSACLNYQTHLSNRFRLSSSIGFNYTDYYYEGYYDGYYSCCLITADAHYFFNQPRRLRPYAIGGLFFYLDYGLSPGVKFGLGLDYRLGYHFSLRLETPLYLNVIWAEHTFLPTLGLTYTF